MIPQLIALTSPYANMFSIIQGAGGNTSVKNENGEMLIKASGVLLKNIELKNATALVNYTSIKTALTNLEFDVLDEKKVKEFNTLIKNVNKYNTATPSMETAFHSLYYKYVLHTHDVLANIYLCSNAYELLHQLQHDDDDFTIEILDNYYTPGTTLSWHIHDNYRFDEAMPNVTFLPNHGVIYSCNNIDTLHKMHTTVQTRLLQLLQITDFKYPSYYIEVLSGYSIMVCTFLFDIWETIQWQLIETELLFPDQAIYINQNISDTDTSKQIYISKQYKTIRITTTPTQAESIMEILIAYFYIYTHILQRGYEPLTINYDRANLITLHSEQYRKQQMEK